jgi:hypothetical protein
MKLEMRDLKNTNSSWGSCEWDGPSDGKVFDLR